METLQNISDGSLCDIKFPKDEGDGDYLEVKEEQTENLTENLHLEKDGLDYQNNLRIKSGTINKEIKYDHDFQQLKDLKHHISSNPKESKPFKCEICEEGFKQNEDRMKHILMVHEKEVYERKKPSNLQFKCKFCDKKYSKQKALNAHILKNHDKPFKCEKCPESFSFSRELKHHTLEVHEGGNLFKCEICENKFTLEVKLHAHISKMHKENRHFKCDSCEANFSNLKELKKHKTVHSGKGLFHCLPCEKNFANKQSLQTHTNNKHAKMI